MNFQYKELAQGRWFEMSLMEQLGNIGSEVSRAINWKNKSNALNSRKSLERALELIDLTISDKKNISRLREILRTREVLIDFFIDKNSFKSTDLSWQKYFLNFAIAARKNR
ncbi:MAG: hypothetical protein EBS06_01815 [Proteobacteria bacterium]|nr:hypothetical protein [Pseudomonadota bacterium]